MRITENIIVCKLIHGHNRRCRKSIVGYLSVVPILIRLPFSRFVCTFYGHFILKRVVVKLMCSSFCLSGLVFKLQEEFDDAKLSRVFCLHKDSNFIVRGHSACHGSRTN